MNKIFIVGRLVSDPQPFVRLVSNITIACADNTNKNETYFFPLDDFKIISSLGKESTSVGFFFL